MLKIFSLKMWKEKMNEIKKEESEMRKQRTSKVK